MGAPTRKYFTLPTSIHFRALAFIYFGRQRSMDCCRWGDLSAGHSRSMVVRLGRLATQCDARSRYRFRAQLRFRSGSAAALRIGSGALVHITTATVGARE